VVDIGGKSGPIERESPGANESDFRKGISGEKLSTIASSPMFSEKRRRPGGKDITRENGDSENLEEKRTIAMWKSPMGCRSSLTGKRRHSRWEDSP